MRWNLLDEVLEINTGFSAIATARWPREGSHPELLFLEMMAQTAGLVFGSLDDFQTDIVFAKVDKAQFQLVTASASCLFVRATAEEIRPEGGWFQTRMDQEGTPIAQARLLLANAGRLKPEIMSSVTFHPQFMNHYKVRQKIKTAANQS